MRNKIFKHPDITIGRYDTDYTYDLAGNIKTLSRKGLVGETNGIPDYGTIDILEYNYANERLQFVTEGSISDKGVPAIGSGYTHDDNGNVITDSGKGITGINYNLINLPQFIPIQGQSITNEYTFAGEKIKKETTGSDGQNRIYLAGVEFVDGELEHYNHGVGRVVLNDPNGLHFQYKIGDHLGNTVVLFEDKDEDGIIDSETTIPEEMEVLQRNLYYPFGLAMEGEWKNMTSPKMNYLLSNKELNDDFGLNWSDIGARWYDASIGRWNAVEPLAEHPRVIGLSTYNYCFNNPVSYTDPDGELPIFVVGGLVLGTAMGMYGLASGKSWQQSVALAGGGFVMGATLGLGTTVIAGVGGGSVLAGTLELGAGASYIMIGVGVPGAFAGNAAEQSIRMMLGESKSFNYDEFVLSGAFGISEGMLLPINLIIDTSVKEGLKGQVTYAIRSEVRSATKELAAKLRTAAGPGKMTKDQSIEAAKKLIKGAQAANATEVQAAIKITSTGVEVGVTSFEGGIIEELKSEILDNENE